jgi:hypothetical protein
MEFPKKFSRSYPEGEEPAKIIKGSGYHPSVKIVEYTMVRRVGSTVVYKK